MLLKNRFGRIYSAYAGRIDQLIFFFFRTTIHHKKKQVVSSCKIDMLHAGKLLVRLINTPLLSVELKPNNMGKRNQ
jgi:hypothetical protein